MKKIGLLSDTHGFLDNSIFNHFESCDEIWHAGDFGSSNVADEIAAFKPLRGVYGNIDGVEIRKCFPENLRFFCEKVEVVMTHIGGKPYAYSKNISTQLNSNPPQLFICGHSHIVRVEFDKKRNFLYVNPGAAGKYGFHKVRTIITFEIDETKIQNMNLVELGGRI